jgi:hypothetical protein
MTLGSWFHQILFEDLARQLSSVTTSWKMTPEDDLPGPGQFLACRKPELARPCRKTWIITLSANISNSKDVNNSRDINNSIQLSLVLMSTQQLSLSSHQ